MALKLVQNDGKANGVEKDVTTTSTSISTVVSMPVELRKRVDIFIFSQSQAKGKRVTFKSVLFDALNEYMSNHKE